MKLGHRYFTVQYGNQCFTGDEGYDKYGKAEFKDECQPCADWEGNDERFMAGGEGKKCGGTWRNSVYIAPKIIGDSAYVGCYTDA